MQSKYPETKKVYLRTGYISGLLRTSMKFIAIECPSPRRIHGPGRRRRGPSGRVQSQPPRPETETSNGTAH